jgi:hypothetical protein
MYESAKILDQRFTFFVLAGGDFYSVTLGLTNYTLLFVIGTTRGVNLSDWIEFRLDHTSSDRSKFFDSYLTRLDDGPIRPV